MICYLFQRAYGIPDQIIIEGESKGFRQMPHGDIFNIRAQSGWIDTLFQTTYS